MSKLLAIKIAVTVLLVGGLLAVSLVDLDQASKIAGIVACALALLPVWLLPRHPKSTSGQVVEDANSDKGIRQQSSTSTKQRVSRVEVKGDIDQIQ